MFGWGTTRRRPVSVVLLVLLAFLVAACGQQGSSGSPPQSKPAAPPAAPPAAAPAKPAELTPVRIGYISIGTTYLPIWVAGDSGIMAKYGLKPEFMYIPGPQLMNALLAGQMEFTTNSESHILPALAAGGDPVALASMMPVPMVFFYGQKNIKSMADLKGKRVVTGQRGGLQHVVTLELLNKYGLTPGKDVTVINTAGGQPEIYAAFQTGQAEGTVLVPPGSQQAEKDGYPLIADAAKDGVPVGMGNITSTRTFVNQNPDLTVRLLKAYIEGLEKTHNDPEFAITTLMKYTKVTDRSLATADYKKHAAFWPKSTPFKTAASMAAAQRIYGDFNPKVSTVDIKQAFDTTFLEKACGCKAP